MKLLRSFKRHIASALAFAFVLTLFPVYSEAGGALESYESFDAAARAQEEALSESDLDVPCPSAILMDIDTGTVIYEKDADTKRPIASVTKVMTLLLVMEAIDDGRIKFEDTVCVSENAASMGGSQCFLEPGEEMSVDEMLKAVVIASANDAAVALAEHICGDMNAFISRMNEKAAQLGMESVTFINCTGLDDTEMHQLSARDVAIMSRELLKHEKILNYTTIWMDSIRNGQFGLANTNKLIRFYNGATGLKTGSTSKAKFCLSASAKREDFGVLCVVLGAENSAQRFSAAKSMLDYAFATKAIYKTGDIDIEPVKVWDGKEDSVALSYDAPKLLVDKGNEKNIKFKVEVSDSLSAPVNEGDVVGRIMLIYNEEIIAQSPITAAKSVEKADFGTVLKKLWKIFIMN